jgi:hypothetical protein
VRLPRRRASRVDRADSAGLRSESILHDPPGLAAAEPFGTSNASCLGYRQDIAVISFACQLERSPFDDH